MKTYQVEFKYRDRNEAEYRRMRAHYDVVIGTPPSRSAN